MSNTLGKIKNVLGKPFEWFGLLMKKINHPAWFLTPYVVLFATFIIIPVIIAIGLSFTYFNTIETPEFI